MQYIFKIGTDGKAMQIGGLMPDGYSVIASSEYPSKEQRDGYRAELRYDSERGLRWEYIPIPPSELRESAYATFKCVEYGDDWLTVDEANKLWEAYSAEGSQRADELSALIAEAKAKIRKIHPDKEETEYA